jgi:hypothetical protein
MTQTAVPTITRKKTPTVKTTGTERGPSDRTRRRGRTAYRKAQRAPEIGKAREASQARPHRTGPDIRLYDPSVTTLLGRGPLRRAGLLKVEKHLQTLGYPGRIYIADDEFTDEMLADLAARLMNMGEFLTLPVVCLPMFPEQCHTNVQRLIAGQYPGLQEWNGIGYSAADQGWVHHTWGVSDRTYNERTGQYDHTVLIETTVEFDAYFGFRTYQEQPGALQRMLLAS